MTDETLYNVKAGRLVVFSEGCYSDYGYLGKYVALQDITLAVLKDAIKDLHDAEVAKPTQGWGNAWDRAKNQLQAELIRRGYLLEVDMAEIYLGDYGLDDDFKAVTS